MSSWAQTKRCLFVGAGLMLAGFMAGCGNQQSTDKPTAAEVSAFAGDPSRMPQSVKNQIAQQQAASLNNAAAVQNSDMSKKAGTH